MFYEHHCYLFILHHGQLFLLNSENLLLVWLIDVRHLIILWPFRSTHLTARTCWLVHICTHSTRPAQLHTNTDIQYGCTAPGHTLYPIYIYTLTGSVTLQEKCVGENLLSDLRFGRHSRFSSSRGFWRKKRRSGLSLLTTTSTQPSGQKLFRFHRLHNV